jgi:tRNA A-37 threonylcarbamoyl transferase component Bud32
VGEVSFDHSRSSIQRGFLAAISIERPHVDGTIGYPSSVMVATEDAPTGGSYEEFSGESFTGKLARAYRPDDPAAELARLLDPTAAIETIHWGRNYIYAAEMRTASGPVEVVVKQFRNHGWRRVWDRRLRGSKALRSWRSSSAMREVDIPTPEPVLLAESGRPDGPSFFVTRRLEGVYEVRHFFRRLTGQPDAGEFPEVGDADFLAQLGRFCRSIHDAGVWYRDLSMGNVLVQPDDSGGLDLWLVDCNRARVGRRLGVVRRIRDLCRFPIVQPHHGEAFLGGYWGEVPSKLDPRWWFWVASVRGYLAKHAIKSRLRSLKLRRRHSHGSGHHPHIPPAAADASTRDKAVWDYLSDQPHQHASNWEKLLIRIADSPDHIRNLAVVASSAPAVRRRYRELKDSLYRTPVEFGGVGVCVRPWPHDPARHLAAVEELCVRTVLLRLHPWERDHDAEENLAASLHRLGYDVAFALPQNRELVRNRKRWRKAVAEIADRFTPFGRCFQVGQAPNRSKWGIWSPREYVKLYLDAAEILRRYEGVELLGPAVIDFEYQTTLALVNRRAPQLTFDILSALLYVDRRGAPENRQLGFNTVEKAVMLRAISEKGRNTNGRCWITEVNWPLWEGPHSPAGKAVSVDEETQADYLVRYYLLVLGTGLIERVYWWQMLARGYGLMVAEPDGSLRARPSYHAMRALAAHIGGATFTGPLPAVDGAYLYRFERDGQHLVVGWSVRSGLIGELPAPPVRALNRDGEETSPPIGKRVVLGPSPVYFYI